MNAHAFINFVLDAEAGKHIAETIQYATANKAAKDLMPDEYRNNPVIFPSAEVIAKCEPGLYLGEEATKVRDEIWTADPGGLMPATACATGGADDPPPGFPFRMD